MGGFVSPDGRDAAVTAQRCARLKPPLLGQPRLRSYGDASDREHLSEGASQRTRIWAPASRQLAQVNRSVAYGDRSGLEPRSRLSAISVTSALALRPLSPPPHEKRAAGTRAARARLRPTTPGPSLAAGAAPPSTLPLQSYFDPAWVILTQAGSRKGRPAASRPGPARP